ncbi:MAG: OsmC family protein [Propionibacteriaceae bacterium]
MTEIPPRKQIEITRDELGVYTAHSKSGATLQFGRGEGLLTPVELLLAAIGGCSAIDVDFMTTKRSEPDSFVVDVSAEAVTDANGGHRLDDVAVGFQLRFPDTAEGKAAADVVERTITQSRDRLCTVSRTVAHETSVSYANDGSPLT